MFNFSKSAEEGTAYLAMSGAEEWSDWQIKISENYEDPLEFAKHALFMFEDLTYIVERVGFAVDLHTGLRKEIKSILEDVRLCFPVLYHSSARLGMSAFPIGTSKTDTITRRVDFLYESRLRRRRKGLEYERMRLQSPGWPESAHYQGAGVYAIFDHLVTKASKAYEPQDLRHFRVLYGIDVTIDTCERAGMFGSTGMLKEDSFGKLPKSSIEAMESITDDELKEHYANQIDSPVKDYIEKLSGIEVVAFIQSLIAENHKA